MTAQDFALITNMLETPNPRHIKFPIYNMIFENFIQNKDNYKWLRYYTSII